MIFDGTMEMTNIIQFPEKLKQNRPEALPCQSTSHKRKKVGTAFKYLFIFIQTVLVLLWPIIRWLVYLDLFFYFLKMIMHTNNHAGFDFMLHYPIVLSGILFVFLYRPNL